MSVFCGKCTFKQLNKSCVLFFPVTKFPLSAKNVHFLSGGHTTKCDVHWGVRLLALILFLSPLGVLFSAAGSNKLKRSILVCIIMAQFGTLCDKFISCGIFSQSLLRSSNPGLNSEKAAADLTESEVNSRTFLPLILCCCLITVSHSSEQSQLLSWHSNAF